MGYEHDYPIGCRIVNMIYDMNSSFGVLHADENFIHKSNLIGKFSDGSQLRSFIGTGNMYLYVQGKYGNNIDRVWFWKSNCKKNGYKETMHKIRNMICWEMAPAIFITSDSHESNFNYTVENNGKISDTIQRMYDFEFKKYISTNHIKVLDAPVIREGLILTKHPFLQNTYINLESMESAVFQEKIRFISEICQKLGAVYVKGHAMVTKESNFTCNGNIEVKPFFSGNAEVAENKKYIEEYSREDYFSGSATATDYKNICDIAKHYGLDKDSDIRNLIEQSNPANINRLKSRTIKFELSRETNQNFEISAEIPKINLNANYKQILDKKRTIMYELHVEF